MIFHEEQRFAGGWRWFWTTIILGPGALGLLTLLILSVATGVDFRMTLLIVAAVQVVLLGLLVLVLRNPVTVRVTAEDIHIRVPPFVDERILPAEIVSVEEVNAGLFRRYGAGVGKRFSDRRARFTVGNDAGVVLQRTNGWWVVIGSHYPAELAAAIQELRRRRTTAGSEHAPDGRERVRRVDEILTIPSAGSGSLHRPSRAG